MLESLWKSRHSIWSWLPSFSLFSRLRVPNWKWKVSLRPTRALAWPKSEATLKLELSGAIVSYRIEPHLICSTTMHFLQWCPPKTTVSLIFPLFFVFSLLDFALRCLTLLLFCSYLLCVFAYCCVILRSLHIFFIRQLFLWLNIPHRYYSVSELFVRGLSVTLTLASLSSIFHSSRNHLWYLIHRDHAWQGIALVLDRRCSLCSFRRSSHCRCLHHKKNHASS